MKSLIKHFRFRKSEVWLNGKIIADFSSPYLKSDMCGTFYVNGYAITGSTGILFALGQCCTGYIVSGHLNNEKFELGAIYNAPHGITHGIIPLYIGNGSAKNIQEIGYNYCGSIAWGPKGISILSSYLNYEAPIYYESEFSKEINPIKLVDSLPIFDWAQRAINRDLHIPYTLELIKKFDYCRFLPTE